MSQVANQKGSKIEGGLISDEFLDAQATEASVDKGAQQFFSPPVCSKLAKHVIGDRVAVVDLTAGDGSLLTEFPEANRFGVELDPDQIANGKKDGKAYQAIQGNLVDIFPMLYRIAPSFEAMVLNPPFGNTWVENTINERKGSCNSTVATFVYATRLLAQDGQFMFIAGRDRLYREVLGRPEAAGVYATINVEDLYDGYGAGLPCAIAFAIHPDRRRTEKGKFVTRDCPAAMLDLCGEWVLEQRAEALGGKHLDYTAKYTQYHTRAEMAEAWRAIHSEHRRQMERKEAERPEFDVQLFDAGQRIQVEPSAYTLLAVRRLRPEWGPTLQRLNGMSVKYFVQNERDWHTLKSVAADGLITVAPDVEDAIDKVLANKRRILVPLYEIKPQQRLGYLDEQDTLKCIKSDVEKNFVAGERYALYTQTISQSRNETRWERNKKTGEPEERQYVVSQKVMQVRIGHFTMLDSGQQASENIKWLVEHFEMPDPGDIATMFPDEVERMRNLIRQIEAEMIEHAKVWDEEHNVPEHKRFTGLRKFQIEDLARMAVKGSGLIAWEQGLGKTLGALVYAELCHRLGAKDHRLFIVPGDLIPQWRREAKRFFGRNLELIQPRKMPKGRVDTVHAQLRSIRKHLKSGGSGWYITYFEALSVVHTRRSEAADPVILDVRKERKIKPGTGKYGKHPDTGVYGYHPVEYIEVEREITSKEYCPECWRNDRISDKKTGTWNGLTCRYELPDGSVCGYAHYKIRVKPAGSLISTAFRKGVIVIDELTFVKGDTSARSEVVRGLRARYKLGMTGTPIKNYIPDAFWLLWWCLGNASERFPYGYKNKPKFLNDFAVMEAYYTGKGNRLSSPRARPEVTNLSMLWRLLASSIIRRRKEETGEKLVARLPHTITAPLGCYQQRYLNKALADFPKLFADLYPDHPVVQAGMHTMMAPMLGLQQKLDYGAILPEADPHLEWWGIEGVSNWTPAMFKVLETAMCLVKQGRKVLIGSPIVETSRFIAEALQEKGVKAIHVLDESTGKTMNKNDRAEVIYDFQTNDADVLCTGIQAIRLGHNLDAANSVILHGLPWDFESLDQFIARVHRLTSQKDVDIYAVVPRDTLTQKKWELLAKKGDAAAIALDGRLIEQQEEKVDEAEVIREMMERGVKMSEDDIEEADVLEAWENLPQLNSFEVPESFTKAQAEKQAELRTEALKLAGEKDAGWITFGHSMLDLLTMANAEITAGVEAMFASYGEFVEQKKNEVLLTDEDRAAIAWWMEADPQEYEVAMDAEYGMVKVAQLARAAYNQATEEPEQEQEPLVYRPDAQIPLPGPATLAADDEQIKQYTDDGYTVIAATVDGTKTHEPTNVDDEGDDEPDPVPATTSASEVAAALKEFKELHESGVLDDDEFATAKANLIAQLKPSSKKKSSKPTTTEKTAEPEQLSLV